MVSLSTNGQSTPRGIGAADCTFTTCYRSHGRRIATPRRLRASQMASAENPSCSPTRPSESPSMYSRSACCSSASASRRWWRTTPASSSKPRTVPLPSRKAFMSSFMEAPAVYRSTSSVCSAGDSRWRTLWRWPGELAAESLGRLVRRAVRGSSVNWGSGPIFE